MNKKYLCLDEDCQEWPRQGKLKKNMNLDKKELIHRLRGQFGETHRYIVTSIKNESHKLAPANRFIQTGCGPNFQGDLITLCTCRPDLRSRHVSLEWAGKWIVGFTSKRLGRHYLFFLMKISRAFQSQAEIWKDLPRDVRDAKNATLHVCGDLFEPELDKMICADDKWNPQKYQNPKEKHAHAQDDDPLRWHKDIRYPVGVDTLINRQCFLIGDAAFSFLWCVPKIYHEGDLTPARNLKILRDVQDLISDLVGV